MKYLFRNLCSLYLLLDVLTGYNHVLDRSTVRDGDKFVLNCDWNVVSGGANLSSEIYSSTIFKMPYKQNIFSCNRLREYIKTNNFSRPWIFRGSETCLNINVPMIISVEVTDSKCSDANVYGCRFVIDSNDQNVLEVTEQLKRDASCNKMGGVTPARNDNITTKTNSAHQETSPMIGQLVVIIFSCMLAQ